MTASAFRRASHRAGARVGSRGERACRPARARSGACDGTRPRPPAPPGEGAVTITGLIEVAGSDPVRVPRGPVSGRRPGNSPGLPPLTATGQTGSVIIELDGEPDRQSRRQPFVGSCSPAAGIVRRSGRHAWSSRTARSWIRPPPALAVLASARGCGARGLRITVSGGNGLYVGGDARRAPARQHDREAPASAAVHLAETGCGGAPGPAWVPRPARNTGVPAPPRNPLCGWTVGSIADQAG